MPGRSCDSRVDSCDSQLTSAMATNDSTTPTKASTADDGCRACSAARLRSTVVVCSASTSSPSTPCVPAPSPPDSDPGLNASAPPRDPFPNCASASPRRRQRSASSWRAPVLLLAFFLVLMDCPSPANCDRQRVRQKGKMCVMPRFIKLPPPIIYRTTYSFTVPKFECQAFPKNAGVVFLQMRPKENHPIILSKGQSYGTATYPIDTTLYTTPDTDFYCRANTECGHLISRPFRIVPANIYPYSEKEPSMTVSFYKGNIAQVQCSIPRSQPGASVQFLKDGVVVGHSDKFLVARQPDVSWVALLIKEFSSSDVGNYSCKAKNPASHQEMESKAVTRLSLQKASSAFEVRFHKQYPYRNTQQVTVREGDNVTLYCLPEGAPIPTVRWFRVSGNPNVLREAGAKDLLDFGAMRINSVRPQDASTYTCSVHQGDRQISRSFELKVQQRLKIRVPPEDRVVEKIGSSQKLSCEADGGEGEITIQWYFNAQLINPIHKGTYVIDGSTLKITSVTTDLLGIYQCVAKTEKEWTSASAAVIQKGDRLRRGEESVQRRTVYSREGITASVTCPLTEKEYNLYDIKWYKDNRYLDNSAPGSSRYMPMSLPPTAYMNMMISRMSDSGLYNCRFYKKGTGVLVKEDYVRLIIQSSKDSGAPIGQWEKQPGVQPAVGPDTGGRRKPGGSPNRGGEVPSTRPRGHKKLRKSQASVDDPDAGNGDALGLSRPEVRVIYDNLAASVEWNYTGAGEVDSYTLLYRQRETRPMYSLKNNPVQKWSNPQTLLTNYKKTSYLVSDKPLMPGCAYKFRVIAYLKKSVKDQVRVKSRWSEEADFFHILSSRPEMTEVKSLSSTSVYLKWSYQEEPGIKLDQFVVNYREQIAVKRYSGYATRLVHGGERREVSVDGLKPGTYYQFVVYGVLHPFTPAQRRITLFSNQKLIQTLVPTMLPPGAEKAENNRVTFLIMGCVAGLLIVVVAVLMSACLWKQRQEKRRMRDESLSVIYASEFPSHYPTASSALQAALNGTSIDSNYKDPKFLVPGTNSASSQLLLSNLGDGAVWQQQHHHGAPPLPHPRLNHSANGGLRLNPEAAGLLMNYDERFTALPPPLPPTGTPAAVGYFGNGTLRQSMYATRGVDDPLYATRLHPAYAVTSPVGGIYPLPAPLGGPPGRFSPYAVAVPPMNNGDGAESVYSYFSQQEAGTHTDGPTPYSASRTVDRPRHHRRKRRRPTNTTTCSQSGLESGSETGPHMKDMAVNTDMSSSDAIYESSLQASTTASPPPRMGALMMGGLGDLPAGSPAAYKSPPGGPEIPPPPAHPISAVAALSTPLTSVASSSPSSSSGPPSSHTLTRRGTPNLFLDPPRVRDYTEYGVSPEPAVPAV